MRYHTQLLAGIVLGVLTLCGAVQAQDGIPVPTAAQVTDQTQTLTGPEIAALQQKLAAYETAKGTQIAVLLVATTAPEDIEQFSNRVFTAWQVGRAHIDDGLLFVIAKQDRKIRLEVGRGLEGAIPDIYAKRIVADQIRPALRAGRYADGINAGVDAAIKLASAEKLPTVQTPADSDTDEWGVRVAIVVIPVFVLLALFTAIRGSRQRTREKAEAQKRNETVLAAMRSDRVANVRAAAAVTAAGAAYSAQRRRQVSASAPARSSATKRRGASDESGTTHTSYAATTSSYSPPSSGGGDSGGWSGGGGGSAGGGASSDF